jgi:hypothetical protein
MTSPARPRDENRIAAKERKERKKRTGDGHNRMRTRTLTADERGYTQIGNDPQIALYG